MDQEYIKKEILSGIIGRYIHEIAEDPGRAVRKLLDMAERTSDGPTQKICYQMMQRMATNQTSPYYDMIHHLVTHTSPETIKQFGINLGHNAWTFGSGHVRQITENKGIAVPWAVLIDRSSVPERVPFSDISDLIDRGRKMDIYGWMFFAGDEMDEWDSYAELFLRHKDSVFAVCVDPGVMDDQVLEEASEITNLMIIVNTDEQDWQEFAERLAQKQCLFSVFRTISLEEDIRDILDGSWFEEITPYYPLMAFTLAADDCSDETAADADRYMWQTRLDQVYPVLPSNLISDFTIISRLVSHKAVLYRIETDGSVSVAEDRLFRRTELYCGDLFNPSEFGL